MISRSALAALAVGVSLGSGCTGKTVTHGRDLDGESCATPGAARCVEGTQLDVKVLERCTDGFWTADPSCPDCLELNQQARCLVRDVYVPDAAQTTYYTHAALMTYQLFDSSEAGSSPVRVYVEVYPGSTSIPTPDFQGPVVFSADDTDYSTCSLCVLAELNGKTFMAQSGVANLLLRSAPTSATGSIDLLQLTLREVTIDQETWATSDWSTPFAGTIDEARAVGGATS